MHSNTHLIYILLIIIIIIKNTLDSAVIIPVSPSSGVVEDRVEVSCGGRVELCVTSSLSALAQDPRHFRHCLEHQYLLRRINMSMRGLNRPKYRGKSRDSIG